MFKQVATRQSRVAATLLAHNSMTSQLLQKACNNKYSTAAAAPFKVAIVGSGPAGFYAAKYLLQQMNKNGGRPMQISMIEKLPTPYGLVRYGVAPDHPEVKLVTNDFEKIASTPENNFNFFGNVSLGTDITIEELRNNFDAVILSYGADGERKLGIKGEDTLQGVESAREFVNWYNGFPIDPVAQEQQQADNNANKLPLPHANNKWFQQATKKYVNMLHTAKNVVIIGNGNVAVDVARLIAKPTTELRKYDTTEYALDALNENSVEHVQLIGRRGPVQAACTTNELRELTKIEGAALYFNPDELKLNELETADLEKAGRPKRRLMDIMQANTTLPAQRRCTIEFKFLRNPVEFLGDEQGKLRAVRFEKTKLVGTLGNLNAVSTGEYEDVACNVAFRSIGYKSHALPGIPFDHGKGIVPNRAGKVIENKGSDNVVKGLYVCGWLKRGPTGVILSNIVDAQETVSCIMEDLLGGKLIASSTSASSAGGAEGLASLLGSKGVNYVTFEQYKKIERYELSKGKEMGKIREKLTDIGEMLNIAKQ